MFWMVMPTLSIEWGEGKMWGSDEAGGGGYWLEDKFIYPPDFLHLLFILWSAKGNGQWAIYTCPSMRKLYDQYKNKQDTHKACFLTKCNRKNNVSKTFSEERIFNYVWLTKHFLRHWPSKLRWANLPLATSTRVNLSSSVYLSLSPTISLLSVYFFTFLFTNPNTPNNFREKFAFMKVFM